MSAAPFIFLGIFTVSWLIFAGVAWFVVIRHERTSGRDAGEMSEEFPPAFAQLLIKQYQVSQGQAIGSAIQFWRIMATKEAGSNRLKFTRRFEAEGERLKPIVQDALRRHHGQPAN